MLLSFAHCIYFSFTIAAHLRSKRTLLADAIDEVDCHVY